MPILFSGKAHGGVKMVKYEGTYICLEDEELIEEGFYDAKTIYSKNGTDHMLENDEISAAEEAFMNGYDEADELDI